MIQKHRQIWAVVPAAGIGTRMQSTIPKQYLQLNSLPILQLTLDRLLSVSQVEGVVVAINANDDNWKSIELISDKPLIEASGGEQRCDSVINAMQQLRLQPEFETQSAWVLVHDAVRPCVSVADIEKLISEAIEQPGGGILATPVRDTMKRQDDEQNVAKTIDRTGLWHALTPQFFPYEALLEALIASKKAGIEVTDEASAMEYAGFSPRLVSGSDKNIKITRPEDLELAQHYLTIERDIKCV